MDNYPCTTNAKEAEVLQQYRIAARADVAAMRRFNRKYNIETPQNLGIPEGWGGYGRRELPPPPPPDIDKSLRDYRNYVRVPGGRFGKVLRPYRKHLHKETPKGIWFNTRFGVKRLRANRYGMYIKASKKNFYLHKW
tara:strand:+ start:998 stop:1408 length:411 start_codon:yes stop_codon:yes gene_type:complete